ncbi:MAG: amidohydrolase family protein, partial [Haliea sp.]|uniref:amidohydrolase family protein n=1 Tax=Haliea sp. TaxID=1932666 RepID=UPI0032EAC60C
GERITSITSGDDLPKSEGVKIIDGGGSYLVPGLMDMHYHLMIPEHATLNMLRGVTTIRNMWGNPQTLAWRAAVEEGTLPGARVITAGAIIDGSPAIQAGPELTDPREADLFVLKQKRAGYDFVKTYSRLQPDVFTAILEAGRKNRMEIAGHVPQDVPMLEAIRGGMRTSEHMIGVLWAVARDRSLPNPSLSPYDDRAKALLLRLAAGEVSADDFIDPERVRELARVARSEGHWFVPTIRVMRNFTTDPVPWIDGIDDFFGPFMKPYIDLMKEGKVAETFFKLSEEHQRAEDVHLRLQGEALLALYEAGAPILAGTDSFPAAAGTVLVDEMLSLHTLGMSIPDVLRAATLEPARYLRQEGNLGEVRPGLIADLVLVEGNPLEDLGVLRNPLGVAKAGEWYPRATIEQMLAELAAVIASKSANDSEHK